MSMMRSINTKGKKDHNYFQNFNIQEVDTNSNVNTAEPHHFKTLKYHADTISQIVFNPNNKELISASNDHNILIWNMNIINSNPFKPRKLSGHKSLVNDVAISSTGLIIASASSDCTVRVWSNSNDDSNNTSSQVFKHNSLPVKSVDISCDSKLLVTGGDDKSVKIIKISDKKVVANIPAHSNWVKCVRFSRDSRLIVSASDDKSVKLWDVNKNNLNSTLANVHNGVVNVVRFHPDNFSLATGCFDKKIRIFDIRSKQLVQSYDEHTKPVTCLDFHPSGYYMASTSFDETIKIFDLRYGEVLYTLTGHEGATTAVAFSKFGEILATGGSDSIINLWNTNLDEEDDRKCTYNKLPVECDFNLIPQSDADYTSEKSSPKIFNSETGLNYRNNSEMQKDRCDIPRNKKNENNTSVNYENISEELSKVFERMVYQLELITITFKNFETRIAKVEECIDMISKKENINSNNNTENFEYEEHLKNELVNKLILNNFTYHKQNDS